MQKLEQVAQTMSVSGFSIYIDEDSTDSLGNLL